MAFGKRKKGQEQPVVEIPPQDAVVQDTGAPEAGGNPQAGELSPEKQRQQEILERERQRAEAALLAGGALVKQKKKQSLKRVVGIVILAVVALAVVVNVVSGMLKGPTPTYVETVAVARGDVQQTLGTTGTIASGQKVTVVSPVGAPLAGVDAELGRVVNKGDKLFSYDLELLNQAYRTAAAASSLAGLQKQEAINESNKSAQEVVDAQASADTFAGEEASAQARADELAAQSADRQAALAADQAKLAGLETRYGKMPKEEKESADGAALAREIAKLQASIERQQGKLSALNTRLAEAQQAVQEKAAQKETMKGARDVAEKAVLSTNQQHQLGLQGVSAAITLEAAAADLERAQAGVSAPISGVVTSLEAVPGILAGQYAPLCTIESLDKVDVVIKLSRYDLERVREGQRAVVSTVGKEYEGMVTKINSMATQSADASGNMAGYVSAVVSLSNPDADIRLGIEANVDLQTGRVDDVLTVPLSAVNTDVNGTYCFVVEDGTARRRDIATGMSGEAMVEVTQGLAEEDEVILSSQNVMENALVTTDPAYQPQATLMQSMMG